MKSTILILVLVLTVVLGAQTPEAIHSAPQNYVMALESPMESMVESALFGVVKFKLYFPYIETGEIELRLKRLIIDGETAQIRYKAFLAATFLNNPDLLATIRKHNYKDENAFFQMLQSRLPEKQLG